MSDNQKHPYHLVDPSPWPLVTAMSLLVLAYGFVLFMHDEKIIMFAIGSVALILSSFFWWRDIVSESEGGQFHNKVSPNRFKIWDDFFHCLRSNVFCSMVLGLF